MKSISSALRSSTTSGNNFAPVYWALSPRRLFTRLVKLSGPDDSSSTLHQNSPWPALVRESFVVSAATRISSSLLPTRLSAPAADHYVAAKTTDSWSLPSPPIKRLPPLPALSRSLPASPYSQAGLLIAPAI